jgi:hypothetical protein
MSRDLMSQDGSTATPSQCPTRPKSTGVHNNKVLSLTQPKTNVMGEDYHIYVLCSGGPRPGWAPTIACQAEIHYALWQVVSKSPANLYATERRLDLPRRVLHKVVYTCASWICYGAYHGFVIFGLPITNVISSLALNISVTTMDF